MLIAGSIVLFAGFVVTCLFKSRTPHFNHVEGDILICAAHSDDCAVMGAEMAYGALKAKKEVRIVYLTCSAAAPDSLKARERRQEALAAWASIGVLEDRLTFIDLPQSDVSGTSLHNDEQRALAAETVSGLLKDVPTNSFVLIPAAGESHPDHRTIRQMTLEAAKTLEEKDLRFVETPEYNGYLSAFHQPVTVLKEIILSVPLARRFIKPPKRIASFASGPAGFIYTDTPERLRTKFDLYDYFASQNPETLKKFFGECAKYRAVDPAAALQDKGPWRTFKLFGRKADFSVAAMLALIAFVLVSIFRGVGVWMLQEWSALSLGVGIVTLAILAIGSAIKNKRVFGVLVASMILGAGSAFIA